MFIMCTSLPHCGSSFLDSDSQRTSSVCITVLVKMHFLAPLSVLLKLQQLLLYHTFQVALRLSEVREPHGQFLGGSPPWQSQLVLDSNNFVSSPVLSGVEAEGVSQPG